MIRFDASICRDLESAGEREWLETNGLGGYASSTITGINTRRYHGLLVAATDPPTGRMVLLSKLEETLVIEGRRYELSANRYPGVVHPQGYQYLQEFRLDAGPVFVYEADGVRMEKSVQMTEGENTTTVRYVLRTPGAACRLEVRPLIAFRDYHATTHENAALNARYETSGNTIKLEPYAGVTAMYLHHSAAAVEHGQGWYRSFEYDRERERGLDDREDLFNPLALTFDMAAGEAVVVASTERSPQPDTRSGRSSAAQFLVRRGSGHSLIAGYHWFADWGRDTMISLPALTIGTGRTAIAKSILLEWARHIDGGMLPNRFPDAGQQPEYNSVDASLWFVEAVRALVAETGDREFVQTHLLAALTGIIDAYRQGTRYGIHADADGLLAGGEPGIALTWMDARIGGEAVTPRHGKAVEVQALWYNALLTMAELSGDSRYADLAAKVRAAFLPAFWNETAGSLYDVVAGDARDGSIRPNQIFACSLHHKLLSREQAEAVLAAVERDLLTPYGLRTLSPHDPQYRGRFAGDMATRDRAYHQGTVWPWLLRPYLAAYRFVHNREPAEALTALRRYQEDRGCGQICEVFDGDPPHRPGGCIAQAWSLAAILE